MEEILAKFLADLLLGVLVGSVAALGTTFLKSIFMSTSRVVNLGLTFISVAIFSYLVVIYYGGLGYSTLAVVFLYANVGAKGLYEAVSSFTKQDKIAGPIPTERKG